MPAQRPQAWRAADAQRDTSWILRLTDANVASFDHALAHARSVGKAPLDMTRDDFPLDEGARQALARAVDLTQGRWGMCLVKGFPVDRWSEDDTRLAYWGMGLHMGVARTQNRASDFMNDVRDVGAAYKTTNGRGYNTNAGLDFHTDSGDIVGLICRRAAKSGGESKVVSSIALRDAVAQRRPDLIPVLQQPFYYSYQGAQDPSQPPYYPLPILGSHPTAFAFRINRKNVVAAQRDFDDVPRLTQAQIDALDLLDTLLTDPELCFAMQLEQGDMQLLNNYVTVHSRTNFEDYEEFDRKRHLLRLWLAVPGSQPLPDDWAVYFTDVRAGAVRGGLRGSARSAAFDAFEQRQAAALGMPLMPWPVGSAHRTEAAAA
ncbi:MULTISPECIES: TauD/TfdA family dioxygenase [unclassified Cupriavidus]|uniref:TauD/TfdA family dioxygenase n=1 Tax=unclassified Cupriavidus TaxID=2640874 RepID=UPI001C002109|nr:MULTISPECIES: TauD/TfdA family dioxygenase [unclassified Cupriavidus]MCA3188494.1 TauD/TfdA family dioxygenase [Cupriavidus sp.]MCA3199484.1 TauD/TfdA family dioxygenase [Cupriavidus sp.]MCA3204497.1 TauD/TfdA family dioxygenase [Cupriavidus sp.]MCA3206009.1 TauD/TfdA family dioxygenase [Cupriavidus sp.]MCA3236087.1 TauD/TfdA family dioxygenase [Cupriavidus sp.]